MPVGHRPLDLGAAFVNLVRLSISIVVVLFAGADDYERSCTADPGCKTFADVVLLARHLGDRALLVRVRDDHEPLALAEACARRAPDRRDDAFEDFAGDWVGLEGAHHTAPFEDLAEFHCGGRIRP